MKATGTSVLILRKDGFESDCPETKFQTITLQSQIRSSRTQMFFKIRVLKNLATVKQFCGSLILMKLQAWRSATLWKKSLQQRSFPVNIAKFLGTVFCYRTPPVAAFVSLINNFRLGQSAYLLFLIKNNMRRFVDLL